METFLTFWQQIPQRIDPVLITVGPLRIQYYGLMYLVAFAITYSLVLYRIRSERRFSIDVETVQNLTTSLIIGLILGARLGYAAFYNPAYYARYPWEIFLPFDFSNGLTFTGISGMSYHGGLIGVIGAAIWYTRKANLPFWEMVDLYVPVIPLGYTFGRIGNFINGELYGRVTQWSFGMRFPLAQDNALRHPSQLYEAFFEGIFLFVVLWAFRRSVRTQGATLGLYLMGYGIVRFFIEFFREPDAHLGFVWFRFSMGQLLCMLMTGAGLGIYLFLVCREKQHAAGRPS